MVVDPFILLELEVLVDLVLNIDLGEVVLEVVAKIDNQDYLGFFSGAGLLAVGDGCSQQEQHEES